MRIERLARACVIAALAFAACGGDEPAAPAPAETDARRPRPPTEAPDRRRRRRPTPRSDGSSPAINSVTVDPGDGTIMVGSGPALYRLAPGEKEAERLTGHSSTGGTVSGNLVVRFAGPERPARLRPSAGGRRCPRTSG